MDIRRQGFINIITGLLSVLQDYFTLCWVLSLPVSRWPHINTDTAESKFADPKIIKQGGLWSPFLLNREIFLFISGEKDNPYYDGKLLCQHSGSTYLNILRFLLQNLSVCLKKLKFAACYYLKCR